MRKLGSTTLPLAGSGQIGWRTGIADDKHRFRHARRHAGRLREDNLALRRWPARTHDVCDEAGDVATTSLLEVWIGETERRVWFLFEATRPQQRLTPASPQRPSKGLFPGAAVALDAKGARGAGSGFTAPGGERRPDVAPSLGPDNATVLGDNLPCFGESRPTLPSYATEARARGSMPLRAGPGCNHLLVPERRFRYPGAQWEGKANRHGNRGQASALPKWRHAAGPTRRRRASRRAHGARLRKQAPVISMLALFLAGLCALHRLLAPLDFNEVASIRLDPAPDLSPRAMARPAFGYAAHRLLRFGRRSQYIGMDRCPRSRWQFSPTPSGGATRLAGVVGGAVRYRLYTALGLDDDAAISETLCP